MIPRLLWTSYFRYLRKNLWLPLLCLCAIATGVAVILGVDLASISARASFALSTQALTGRATHSLVGVGRTVPDSMFRRLRVDHGIRKSAPVVEGYVTIPETSGSGLTLTLLGVDPFSDGVIREWTGARGGEDGPSSDGLEATSMLGSANRVVATVSTARRLDWKVDQSRTASAGGQPIQLELAGTFTPSSRRSAGATDGFLLADISTAQELLGQQGLDRIDLVLTPEQVEKVTGELPSDLVLTEAATSQRTAGELSSAFHVSLRALSYLCLLVATFLIFNVVSFSVAHRRQSLARLRILGVTAGQLRALLLLEASALGVGGSAIGLPLGLLLGRGLVPLVARTVNDLYYKQSITDFVLPVELVLKAGLCGMAAAILAAVFPAYWTSRAEPLSLMFGAQTLASSRRAAILCALSGSLGLALSVLLLFHPSLTAGFLSLLGVLIGYSLLVPLSLLGLSWAGRGLSSRLSHRMAILGLGVHLSRTAVAAVALTVAVAATISIAVMVDSFRQTLTLWLANTLRADIYISFRDTTGTVRLPHEQVAQVTGWSEARDWSAQSSVVVPSESGETVLVGVKPGGDYRSSLRFLELASEGWERFERGDGLFLTEPYARRAKKRVGDTLRLSTPRGARELPVLGVYYSYAPDRNTALMGWSGFSSLFGPRGYSGVGLYLEPDADIAQTVSRLKELLGESVEIRATREIKSMALEIFERTFTVTEVLRYLALAIAVIGVLLSLWALGEERAGEVRVLRALGLSTGELFTMSFLQSCWLGAACGLLACPLGALLAKMMISVLNRRAFGWTIDFYPQPEAMLNALVLALLTAMLAGVLPAYRWSRSTVEEGLRERE